MQRQTASDAGRADTSNKGSKPVNDTVVSTKDDHGDTKDFHSQLTDTFLNLEELDPNLFRCVFRRLLRSHCCSAHHLLSGMKDSLVVFGGQVIGQALQAAGRTVADRSHVHPHSMQCHFLRHGDTRRPILYMVDRVRDGQSYSMRHVQAVQNGETIFTAHVSFHRQEPDAIRHQMKMPVCAPPEDLPDAAELLTMLMSGWRLVWCMTCGRTLADDSNFSDHRQKAWMTQRESLPTTIQMRPVVPMFYAALQATSPSFAVWVKTNELIGLCSPVFIIAQATTTGCTTASLASYRTSR